MKKNNILIHPSDSKIITITWNFPGLPWASLALAGMLLLSAGGNRVLANQQRPEADPGAQVDISNIGEAEYNLFSAAKQEPDPQKRAAKLIEFLQKYPKSTLANQIPGDDYKNINMLDDEYSAYYAARKEPDFEKRGAMLLEFIKNHPQSIIIGNINSEYMAMLKEISQSKRYELLESFAEKWLTVHPKDSETCAYVAEAAINLHEYEKSGEVLETIYAMKPSPSLAEDIHMYYQKAGNQAKEIEWAEKLFKMPEFSDDYMLRYGYVMRFFNDNNLPKAVEYAQLTLKSADLAKQPDAKTREQLQKVRRACYHVIGSNLMKQGNYAEAISAFKKALEVETYGQGYYEIGLCLDNQKQIEEAIVYYAAAELVGSEDASKAKARMELLYKVLHNDTLVGIDKVYKRAKDLLSEPIS
jgi:tetratricopeptide (TPR) repeat protein